jgi:hypothetical protein
MEIGKEWTLTPDFGRSGDNHARLVSDNALFNGYVLQLATQTSCGDAKVLDRLFLSGAPYVPQNVARVNDPPGWRAKMASRIPWG